MENTIEAKLKDFKPVEISKTYEIKSTPAYVGLKLVKENAYQGGTSIRYWM